MRRLVRRMTLVAAVALLWGAPATGFAAGFQNYAQSATATAMGGVGVANPNEPNASFMNPALMSQHDDFNIYLGDTLIIPNTTYNPLGGADEEVATESTIFPPPNGHLGYGINDDLSVGIGANFPYGLGITWPNDWVGREDVEFQSVQTLNITPVVSYTIPNTDFTLAGGGQIAFGKVELKRDVVLREDRAVETHLGGNGNGFGGLGALLYQPNDQLTFGAQYRSAIKMNYDGRVHFEGEEGTPFEQQFVDGDVSTSLTLPHLISLGAGWRMKRLFLELDFNYTFWQTYDEVVIDFERDLPQEESVIEGNWHGAGAVRLGAQYDVTDAIPVRLGFGFDMTPIPDDYIAASLPGNHRLVGSFGSGYTMKNGLRFDLAYQLVSALEREVTETENAPLGEYQTTAHLIALNIGYGYEQYAGE